VSRQVLATHGRALLRAIAENDEAAVESTVVQLSQSRRIFAPLVFAVGAFVMWIWLALLDPEGACVQAPRLPRLVGLRLPSLLPSLS
jgi:hypothetical protein